MVAVVTTTLLLVVVALSYVGSHTRGSTATERYHQLVRSAVWFSPDGNFEPTYDDSVLGKLYAPIKIADIKERISTKAAAARTQTEIERRQLLEPLKQFADRSLSDTGPLMILKDNQPQDAGRLWTSVNLDEIRFWLGSKAARIADEKQTDYREYLAAVERQLAREAARKIGLRTELHALESGLSFDWLHIDGAYWVLEVMSWTVFGFLANTLITLFQHCRKRTYSADEYVLIFPKLALAPLLSVVAIALWSSGISSAPISFLNLPIFLIFSFSLGFCTEQLYVALKDITGWFLSRFVKVSEDRVAELAKNVPYTFVHPAPTAGNPAAPSPQNLRQLREQLEQVAQAGFERGAVAKLSSTT